jgi:hypothetical protein
MNSLIELRADKLVPIRKPVIWVAVEKVTHSLLWSLCGSKEMKPYLGSWRNHLATVCPLFM